MNKKDLQKISDWLWEIPKSFRKDMRVPARIYASEKILDEIEPDAFSQVINTACLPGIVNYSLAMPDIHTGYGFVIGGVAAMDAKDGVISPGGVGYDINCGMKLLRSEYTQKEIRPHLEKLAVEIQNEVPSGLGQGRQIKLSVGEIEKILEGGAQRMAEQGFGEKEDLENCESGGRLAHADSSLVSERAKSRGRDQVGTLGSGNHFLEIQRVDEIFDEAAAKAFGLFKDQVLIMIHTGSRGLGHQIATDYIRVMVNAMPKYGIKLPDRELAACPVESPEGKNYLAAMACGGNYAWANRQAITHFIRKAWKSVLGDSASELKVVYDVAHNIAKIENHSVNGEEKKLVVHRKGATRAFPPGHPEIPERYRETGQPVLIPGSMGTASYVLAGSKEGAGAWFSSCHGAGRTMSRHAAVRAVSPQELIKSLESKGIIVRSSSLSGLAEEAPQAYKDIDSVVEVVHQAGLSKKVARLKPLAVIKGE
ncbi:MAG: RtcB family protein [Candidatus Paceibacterota bacterium]